MARPAIPAPAVAPDPPAAEPVVRPAAQPTPSRRRSGMTAAAIPLGVRADLDPRGWLRAFDAYDERQASLFEDQEQPDGGSNGPTRGA
ncbi:hypothetical protein ACFTUC_40825 [Streptomyces sp. NPDC056944]|uniref:hypothetical protein n=1 Tax=Streptomyces sp. NPDC056944 TaxID=3345972 RepID=UPI0036327755